MRLRDEDSSILLKAVLPWFTSDLLIHGSGGKAYYDGSRDNVDVEDLQNFQDSFRNEVGLLDLTLDPLCDLHPTSWEECLRIIQVVLNLLESLLSDPWSPTNQPV
jgi:hypothetical protein